MLIDDVIIKVVAGKGGDGAISFRRNEGNPRGGPDGGNGGMGGDIYLQGVSDLMVLRQFQFKKLLKADNGINGSRKNLFGRKGQDLIIKVPFGTQVTEVDTNKTFEITESTPILIARGGVGGKGNNEFKSAIMQSPRYAEEGGPGEEKQLHLELKLIADVGLIGLPNAGKSSLLAMLTNAQPKIGDYPFTTLEPNLGSLDGIILADIPGLIEGASVGRGLGFKFLKHIEKTKLLIHCIDITSEDLAYSYALIRKEFLSYNKEILAKPEIILLTKSDLLNDKEKQDKLAQLKKIDVKIFAVSVYHDYDLEMIKKIILTKIKETGKQ